MCSLRRKHCGHSATDWSYTDFEYLSATTSKEDYACEDVIEVTIAIRNTGDYDGLEVPQVYVRDMVSSVVMPVQELKGFEKVLY